MKKGIYVIVACCLALLFLTIFIFYSFYKANKHDDDREHVYLTAKSSDGRYIAQIVWQKDRMVSAFLVVTEVEMNLLIIRFRLLGGRDDFSDIKQEIKGLSWDKNVVVLDLRRNHYWGPSRIEIVEPPWVRNSRIKE